MTNEERQRTMDFILEQQARFTSSLQELTGGLQQMKRAIVMLARQFRRERNDLRERIAALVDAQIQTEEIARENDERLRALTAATERNSEITQSNSEAIRGLLAATERSREDIDKLVVATGSNREDIGALAQIVAQMARGRNGDAGAS